MATSSTTNLRTGSGITSSNFTSDDVIKFRERLAGKWGKSRYSLYLLGVFFISNLNGLVEQMRSSNTVSGHQPSGNDTGRNKFSAYYIC
jgi:hypothetical protein